MSDRLAARSTEHPPRECRAMEDRSGARSANHASKVLRSPSLQAAALERAMLLYQFERER